MIDSITTYLKIQERISKNYLNITEDSTDNLTGDKRLKARLGNLKVKQINENLYISGSQPKYLLNNNLDELTKKDIKLVNEKISDELKINYQYSRLYKIEIASNLIMNENVNYYFPCFGDLKNFVKGYIENTIYYGNSKKKITIYNKLKEMRAKKYFIPKKYKNIGDNILRYELRLKNRLLNEFGRKIYFFDLYDESFFQILLEKWKNYYFAIYKINNFNFSKMEKLTAQKGFEFFLIKLMYDKGVDSTFQDFKLFRSNFKSSVEASRCIGKIKSLLNNMKYTESSELIQELDKKILKKVEEYR